MASVKVRECHNEVESEDDGRVSIAQDILRKRTDFLRRIGVRLVAASMTGEPRTLSWSYKTARTTEKQQFSGLVRHHREPATT